jgi:hypothetical protein
MSLNLDPLPPIKPLRRFQGQRIVDVQPDPDGGFPVLISESGDALILIDWRQGKTSWEPTAQAQQLYDQEQSQVPRRRRKDHA